MGSVSYVKIHGGILQKVLPAENEKGEEEDRGRKSNIDAERSEQLLR